MDRVHRRDRQDTQRSERACPACGHHSLALETLPHIDVMGIQPYSDLVGMGDFRAPEPRAIVCLECGARWRDLAAFEAGEQDPVEESQGQGG